jgi:hypothetical protein
MNWRRECTLRSSLHGALRVSCQVLVIAASTQTGFVSSGDVVVEFVRTA